MTRKNLKGAVTLTCLLGLVMGCTQPTPNGDDGKTGQTVGDGKTDGDSGNGNTGNGTSGTTPLTGDALARGQAYARLKAEQAVLDGPAVQAVNDLPRTDDGRIDESKLSVATVRHHLDATATVAGISSTRVTDYLSDQSANPLWDATASPTPAMTATKNWADMLLRRQARKGQVDTAIRDIDRASGASAGGGGFVDPNAGGGGNTGFVDPNAGTKSARRGKTRPVRKPRKTGKTGKTR